MAGCVMGTQPEDMFQQRHGIGATRVIFQFRCAFQRGKVIWRNLQGSLVRPQCRGRITLSRICQALEHP